MKKIMLLSKKRVNARVSVVPNSIVDVYVEGNIGTEQNLNRFTVQSIAQTEKENVLLLVLTKRASTLLMKWDTASGDVDLNYVTGLVKKKSFLRMNVIRKGEVIAVGSDLKYMSSCEEPVKEPVTVGTVFSNPNNHKMVVEYICHDGSLVLQTHRRPTERNDSYPVKTIIVDASNKSFWDSVFESVEIV
ncbi:hypothetical protein PHYNN_158 [Pantoea phage Phynn]|nr:hypothetical protein PHYNN_158 [Pantoea phage Phynn]